MIYGYARVSTKRQSIKRQIENILNYCERAKIYQEIFTGTTLNNRIEYQKLKKVVKEGDIIIFDSVSRMSRNADEGIKEYFEFLSKGIKLIFLKEKYINTDVYLEQLKLNESLKTKEKDLNDTILKGIREYLTKLAEKQIQIAFEQSEKEVLDLRQRTKEGLRQKKLEGVTLGRRLNSKIETKKSKEVKENILRLSKDFKGNLKDIEIIKLLKVSRNSFYKYKKELKDRK